MKELVVDNFAGAGGASIGIERAIGRPIDYAINHSAAAVAVHKANHPDTHHFCEDIWQVDPRQVDDGRPVGLAWFSPDCTHFSKAKGGKPRDNNIRGLAWVVLRWAATVRPRLICLENVEEFQDWCPLNSENLPDKARKGETFRSWKRQLEGLGYEVDYKVLIAANYGAPTSRKRLVLIARCDGQPIVWPKPTHGHGRGQLPFRTAAECIDWSIPCPSIFERRRPLAENTMKRIAKGVHRFVIDAANPFIVPIHHYSAGRENPCHSVEEPLRTITAQPKGGAFALATPHIIQVNHGKDDFRGQEVQSTLPTITAKHGYGLVSAFLAKHYGGVVGHGPDRPIGTITQVDHHGVCAAFLSKFYGQGTGSDMRDHMATITAGPGHIAEVRAFLIKYYGAGTGQAIAEPLHTITSKDRLGLVTVAGHEYAIADIGLRMLQPRELARAQGFPDSYKLLGTKAQQVAHVGNSVPPDMAEAIVGANYRERIDAQGNMFAQQVEAAI